MIAGLNPSDSNPYSTIKDSTVNVIGLNQDCNTLVNGNPWRNPYSNPYVYDAATAVALVGYGPYAAGYSPHMDLAGRRKNATRETTATLKAWLYEHRKNPYPTKSEKVYLAIMTKMTLTQVSTWFANARRRLKKENKMTWSPRNRTTDDDDDRHGIGSNSDQSDDESTCPTIQTTNSSSTTTLGGSGGTGGIPSTGLSIGSSSSSSSSSLVVAATAPTSATLLPLTSTSSSSLTLSTTPTTTSKTSLISNIHYLSNPLSIIQHHHIQQQQIQTEETNRKRKFDENETQERKKPCGIWSLADMAEKNHNTKINQSNIDKQQDIRSNSISSSSHSSSSSSSSPTSSQEKGQIVVGAFKPFK